MEVGPIPDTDLNGDKKIYRAIDLFAGIGGIRLGFQQAFKDRIKFVYACEIDKFACRTYEANFGENPYGDITKVNPEDLPDFDILLAGFPCQAFSIAGRRKGFEDTRGTLFFYIAKILEAKRPSAFLLENVKHLVNHDKGRTFRIIRDVLEVDLEYHIYYKILNAKDFGVPQHRERIFIVGFKDPIGFEFPMPLNTRVKLADILEDNVDDSYYLSQEYLLGLKKHRARHEAKGNGFGYEVISREGIANALVCGGMGHERNLVKDKLPENRWKKEGDPLNLRNNEGIRKMTVREWARLQGFPDSFTFPVAKTKAYRQLGNSVAVPVIGAIAEKMLEALDRYKLKEHSSLGVFERRIIELILKMKKDKAIPRSGKKGIESFKRYINRAAFYFDDVNKLIRDLIVKGIISHTNGKFIYFNRNIIELNNPEELERLLIKKLTKVEGATVKTILPYM